MFLTGFPVVAAEGPCCFQSALRGGFVSGSGYHGRFSERRVKSPLKSAASVFRTKCSRDNCKPERETVYYSVTHETVSCRSFNPEQHNDREDSGRNQGNRRCRQHAQFRSRLVSGDVRNRRPRCQGRFPAQAVEVVRIIDQVKKTPIRDVR